MSQTIKAFSVPKKEYYKKEAWNCMPFIVFEGPEKTRYINE